MRQPVALMEYAADVPFALTITVGSGGVQKVKGTIHARTETLFPNGCSVHVGIEGDRNTLRALSRTANVRLLPTKFRR